MSDKTRQECQRCGRGIPSRRHDTGFCSKKCALDQCRADENSADSERTYVKSREQRVEQEPQ